MATLNKSALIDADDVHEVIDTDLSDAVIHRFINQAYFTSKNLAGRLSDCGGSDALAEIQAQLAAHFIATSREFQPEQESIGGEASVRYRGKTGKGLEATTHGQNALMLDCSGTLAALGKKRATFKVWAHKDIDYDYDD